MTWEVVRHFFFLYTDCNDVPCFCGRVSFFVDYGFSHFILCIYKQTFLRNDFVYARWRVAMRLTMK